MNSTINLLNREIKCLKLKCQIYVVELGIFLFVYSNVVFARGKVHQLAAVMLNVNQSTIIIADIGMELYSSSSKVLSKWMLIEIFHY